MADPFFPSGGGSRRPNWRAGDRVLAPWEPTFLYAGTVTELAAGRVLVRFDDGDSGWVEMALVRPLALTPGQQVMSRRRMGPHFFPGQIGEIDGESVRVEFDDGKEEQTTVAALRIPCEPAGRGAEQVQATSNRAFLDHLQEGDRVWALWNNAALFAGEVGERRGDEAHVHFDDGDQAWVRLEHLLPLEVIVGMFVMARRRTDPQFFPGTVADTEGDRVLVRFDDGGEEWTTVAALALPIPPPQAAPGVARPAAPNVAPAEPVVVTRGWDPRTVLVVGGLIVAAVAAVCFWLGGR